MQYIRPLRNQSHGYALVKKDASVSARYDRNYDTVCKASKPRKVISVWRNISRNNTTAMCHSFSLIYEPPGFLLA